MMEYKLSGNPTEVAKVIQENRIRVQRGVISFTPLDCEAHTDSSAVIDKLQERCKELEAGHNRMSEELSDACMRASRLQTTINRLKESGVDIDLFLDEESEAADNKEAVAEVTDTKEEPEADSKEVPALDSKEPEATPETDVKATKTKRTKKTE